MKVFKTSLPSNVILLNEQWWVLIIFFIILIWTVFFFVKVFSIITSCFFVFFFTFDKSLEDQYMVKYIQYSEGFLYDTKCISLSFICWVYTQWYNMSIQMSANYTCFPISTEMPSILLALARFWEDFGHSGRFWLFNLQIF